jgi:hypothetical protein
MNDVSKNDENDRLYYVNLTRIKQFACWSECISIRDSKAPERM